MIKYKGFYDVQIYEGGYYVYLGKVVLCGFLKFLVGFCYLVILQNSSG